MRFKDLRSVALLTSMIVPLGACTAETKSCPFPEGQFQFEYVYMSGTCSSSPSAHPIKLQPGELRENRSGDQVNTSVVYKGCDVSVEYRVNTIPNEVGAVYPISFVSGEMTVESEEELSGVVMRVEYDPLGAPACQGEYAAMIVKHTSTIGAATD